jgi:hypothetical protein
MLICHLLGVLEANFIRPTHDKQDFERTGLFQRLETRLKDMAKEYWSVHFYFGFFTVFHIGAPYIWFSHSYIESK